jgi:O-antigen chain-terminating methyltransferase
MGPSKADQQEFTAMAARVSQCESSRIDPNQVVALGDNLQAVVQQVAICREDLRDQHRRLGLFLELARKRLPEAFTTEQLTKLLSEESHFLDSLYVAFEDRFRGDRRTVLEGLKVYLPYVEKVAERRGKKLPVLDLACGRGEWLELLNAHAHLAKGVDVNRVALQQCKELGLDVVEEDAIEFLRKQPKNSFSAVTCFHYVEHIEYRSLVALLDEALRVLMPEGVAIIETPNARNILVSAGDFYRDPTHRNPVFPETLESIAELRGFSESAAYFFNDTRTELIPIAKFAFADLNAYVNISRDVAWIGVKPL